MPTLNQNIAPHDPLAERLKQLRPLIDAYAEAEVAASMRDKVPAGREHLFAAYEAKVLDRLEAEVWKLQKANVWQSPVYTLPSTVRREGELR